MFEVAVLTALIALVGVAGYMAGRNDERRRAEEEDDEQIVWKKE